MGLSYFRKTISRRDFIAPSINVVRTRKPTVLLVSFNIDNRALFPGLENYQQVCFHLIHRRKWGRYCQKRELC